MSSESLSESPDQARLAELVSHRAEVNFYVFQVDGEGYKYLPENAATIEYFREHPEMMDIIVGMLRNHDIEKTGAASISNDICINVAGNMQLVRIEMIPRCLDGGFCYLEGTIKSLSEIIDAACIAHDIRTPITLIKGYLELLARDVSRKEWKLWIDIMISRVGKVELIMRYYLERFQLFRDTTRYEEVPLKDIFDAVLEDLKELTDVYKPTIIKCYEEGDIVYGPRLGIEQILNNLLRNALVNSGDNPIISINYSVEEGEDGRYSVLSVQNNGVVPAEMRARIFTFSNSLANGHGLGLFICHSICKSIGGQIWFVSGENLRITTFYVRIPLSRKDAE